MLIVRSVSISTWANGSLPAVVQATVVRMLVNDGVTDAAVMRLRKGFLVESTEQMGVDAQLVNLLVTI